MLRLEVISISLLITVGIGIIHLLLNTINKTLKNANKIAEDEISKFTADIKDKIEEIEDFISNKEGLDTQDLKDRLVRIEAKAFYMKASYKKITMFTMIFRNRTSMSVADKLCGDIEEITNDLNVVINKINDLIAA